MTLLDDPGLGPAELSIHCGEAARSGRKLAAASWGLVAVGVLVRLVRYASHYPLWGDEASLAANFLGRGYRELLQPLDYHQVSPPLFLWIELASIRLFGFSEYSLRLFPTVCGLASVFLFRHVATRLFRGMPLLLSVGVFAVAFHPIRHGAEVKPYASDLLASLALLAAAIEWWRAPTRSGWLWGMAAAVPAILALSQPAIFVAAGIGLGMFAPAWRTGKPAVRLAHATFLTMTALSFLGLLAHATSQCGGGSLEGMRRYWAASFPPLAEPLQLLRWLAWAHTGSMFAYPDGGRDGGSTATAVCCFAAVVLWWRLGNRWILLTISSPFVLTLIAAALRRYPYGGEARIGQHLAPMICLLAGLGGAVVIRTLPRARDRAVSLAVGMLTLLGIGGWSIVQDCVTPYRSDRELHVREFAGWFWPSISRNAELICARMDLGIREPKAMQLSAALNLCYREISLGHPIPAVRLDRVSAEHPLRCVTNDEHPESNPDFVAWRNSLSPRFSLRSVEKFFIEWQDGGRRQVVILYEFVPAMDHPTPIAIRESHWPPRLAGRDERTRRRR